MSAASLVSFRSSDLAWSDTADDERLFKRVTSAVLLATTAVCLSLLLSPKPKEDRSTAQPLPAPMAKLLLENAPQLPVAKLKPIEADATPKTEAKVPPKADRERAVEPSKSEAKQKPVAVSEEPKAQVLSTAPVAQTTAPAAAEVPQVSAAEAARKRVAGLGLLAAKDDIAQVRGGSVATQIRTDIRQGSGAGAVAGGSTGAADGSSLARSMITSNSSGGSGTINTASVSRGVAGSGGLAGRSTTVVVDDTTARNVAAAAKRTAAAATAKSPRSPEEIRLVLSRSKGALDAIYNRALREDPTLQGKVVVEIKIAPTGEVLDCKVVFSDLHAPALEAKLAARIRMIDFGAKDVEVTVEKYPLDFLPS